MLRQTLTALLAAALLLPGCADDLPAPAPPPPQPSPPPPAPGATPDPAAAPCAGGQLKGDRSSRLYYPRTHSAYANLRSGVDCFNSHGEAQNAGYARAP